MRASARFSPDRRYRYTLVREWDDRPGLTFIMLNPSLADEERLDPTVTRCLKRAIAGGFGRLTVVNLFAFITPYPAELLKLSYADAVGVENDRHIFDAARAAGRVICAWGASDFARFRGPEIARWLAARGIELWALTMTKSGQPGHPLYLPDDKEAFRWNPT